MSETKNGIFLDKCELGYNLLLIGLLVLDLTMDVGELSVGQFLPLPQSAQQARRIAVLDWTSLPPISGRTEE